MKVEFSPQHFFFSVIKKTRQFLSKINQLDTFYFTVAINESSLSARRSVDWLHTEDVSCGATTKKSKTCFAALTAYDQKQFFLFVSVISFHQQGYSETSFFLLS
jgi:hypothetical protein